MYDASLAARPEIVALSKIDALPGEALELAAIRAAFAAEGVSTLAISAVTGEGLPALVAAMADRVERQRRADQENATGEELRP